MQILNYLRNRTDLLRIIMVCALMIFGAKLSVPTLGIPVTFSTLFLCISAMLTNTFVATSGQILYLLSGLFFPVFSSDSYGVEFYQSFTAGYVLIFPVVAYLVSKWTPLFKDWFTTASYLVVAHSIVMASGIIWWYFNKEVSIPKIITQGFLVLMPGALIKSVLAAFFYYVFQMVKKKKNLDENKTEK